MTFSPFWKDIRVLRLSTNMRLLAQSHQMAPADQVYAEDFAKWVLDVGDAAATEPDNPFQVKILPGTHPVPR